MQGTKVKSDGCHALIRLESLCHVRSETYMYILQKLLLRFTVERPVINKSVYNVVLN